jgi:hypothetical protein
VRGYVALNSPNRTFIHAGAVAYDGRAIVVPGHSFTGKSTLTAALVRAGATYYSDEFAVLDDDGLVHPYPKPIELRPDSFTQVPHDVEVFGGSAGEAPVPIRLAVITYFRPDAGWSPREISPGEAALSFVSHTATVWRRPQEALRAMSRALSGAIALEGERGEADEVAEQLLERLAQVATR